MRRFDRIKFNLKGDNTFEIVDRNGDLILDSNENYYIYFKNANLRPDGTIEGSFLGYTDDSILDGYCRSVSYDGNGYVKQNGEKIRTARLMIVDNKNKSVVIIQK